jgi:hypothetical protein
MVTPQPHRAAYPALVSLSHRPLGCSPRVREQRSGRALGEHGRNPPRAPRTGIRVVWESAARRTNMKQTPSPEAVQPLLLRHLNETVRDSNGGDQESLRKILGSLWSGEGTQAGCWRRESRGPRLAARHGGCGSVPNGSRTRFVTEPPAGCGTHSRSRRYAVTAVRPSPYPTNLRR